VADVAAQHFFLTGPLRDRIFLAQTAAGRPPALVARQQKEPVVEKEKIRQPSDFLSEWFASPTAFVDRGIAEATKMQAQAAEEAYKAIDESARLWKEMIAQTTRLQAEWMRLGAEAARRGVDAVKANG
jgi:hypothetical protein